MRKYANYICRRIIGLTEGSLPTAPARQAVLVEGFSIAVLQACAEAQQGARRIRDDLPAIVAALVQTEPSTGGLSRDSWR